MEKIFQLFCLLTPTLSGFEMTGLIFMINLRNKNYTQRTEVDVSDITELFGCKIITKNTQTKMDSRVPSDSVGINLINVRLFGVIYTCLIDKT